MSSRSLLSRSLLIVCLAVVTGLASLGQAQDVVAQAKSLSTAFRRAAEQVKPSVVTIIATREIPQPARGSLRELLQDPAFRERFPLPIPPDESTEIGSGVVIDAEGLVLTNNHVVDRAENVIIRLPDGSELEVDDIKTDRMSDLAILRFRPDSPLTAAELGDSKELAIGDWVIAIGSPFDLEATVSAGIISAKGRSIDRIPRAQLIQTDAAINPGNSGGPLVNLDGKVVGLNTAIATSSGGYQGVGFAIPANKTKWVVQELLQHGQVRRAWLGIGIGELTAQAARGVNLRARSGVWVDRVEPDSPADLADVESGDVIVNFAGIRVRAPGDLQAAVERQQVGTQQPIVVMRNGERISLEVTLAALPAQHDLNRLDEREE